MLLKLNNINTYYGDLQALYDVSFQMGEKEIVSIIGSNGAGKSTTLNTISGILRPSSGTIEFRGKRIEKFPTYRIVEMGLIQVPEARLIFPYMTILENLELGAYIHTARKRIKETLEIVFNLFPILKDRKKQLAGTLSGGEQQMLAISRGMMARPKLLILDEPSLGLSPKLVDQIFDTIKKINKEGVSILLVEQNVFDSLLIANRGYVLENGRIILEGKGKELLNNEIVKKTYLGI